MLKQRPESPTTQCLGTSIRVMTRAMLWALVPEEDTEHRQRSTKVLLSRHKEPPRKVLLTHLRAILNTCRTSRMSNAHCVKRDIGCHAVSFSEESQSMSELVLCVVEDCAIIVLSRDTWQCRAPSKASARLLDVR